MRDHYEIIGVESSASDQEIRDACFKIGRDFKQRMADGELGAEARFKEVEKIYEILGDPEKRAKYDRWLSQPKSQGVNIGTKQLLGLVGAVVLFIGVFTPIVSLPLMGGMNYFQNGRGDGTIVLVLAIASFILVLLKKYEWLWFSGGGSLCVMLFTFVNFQLKMSEMKSDMESKLAGNPFRGLADMAMQSIQLQWGWAILIVGAGLVIACAALKED